MIKSPLARAFPFQGLAATNVTDASSMAAERVELRVSGGSDASVRASAAIEIDASGGSDIEVAGNPAERNVNNDRSSDVTWR